MLTGKTEGHLEIPPQPTSAPLISRRDLIRTTLLAGAATVVWPRPARSQDQTPETTPAQRGEDASKFLDDPAWKPVFFSEQQNETLIALSDIIIPATDTPGAKEALVNRYLDLLFSGETAERQQKFLAHLGFIEGESQRLFGGEFRSLKPHDQADLLRPLAYPVRPSFWKESEVVDPGHEHFEKLKLFIAQAYYSSEIGQRELGWDGSFTHGPFVGCPHSPTTHR